MSSLWDPAKFEKIEMRSPRDIIEEQCESIYEITDGTILARLSSYDVINFPNLAKIVGSGFYGEPVLGDIAEKTAYSYEFFITSKNTPSYKYRAFTIKYGITLYPVSLNVDESIATELGITANMQVEDETAFIDCLAKILSSRKISRTISYLLSAHF